MAVRHFSLFWVCLCLVLCPLLPDGPRYNTFMLPKTHFFRFILMWCCTSLFNTWFKVVRCSSWVAECTNRLLMYTMTLEMLLTTVSMKHWKLARQPSRPMGLVTHWNWPMPGTVKAVDGLALRCKIICQKPVVRSMILKIVLPDHLILPMHLLTSFMEYLSV